MSPVLCTMHNLPCVVCHTTCVSFTVIMHYVPCTMYHALRIINHALRRSPVHAVSVHLETDRSSGSRTPGVGGMAGLLCPGKRGGGVVCRSLCCRRLAGLAPEAGQRVALLEFSSPSTRLFGACGRFYFERRGLLPNGIAPLPKPLLRLASPVLPFLRFSQAPCALLGARAAARTSALNLALSEHSFQVRF